MTHDAGAPDATTSDDSHADGRLLRSAAGAFAIGAILHNGDHFRRGVDTVTTQLFWLGNVGMVLTVAALAVVVARHRLAPLVAVSAGFPLALGFAAAHMLPEWSVFSDSFVDNDVSLFSWIASVAEIVGALVFGGAGAVVLRRRGLHSVSGHLASI